jgi:hypothetical protein
LSTVGGLAVIIFSRTCGFPTPLSAVEFYSPPLGALHLISPALVAFQPNPAVHSGVEYLIVHRCMGALCFISPGLVAFQPRRAQWSGIFNSPPLHGGLVLNSPGLVAFQPCRARSAVGYLILHRYMGALYFISPGLVALQPHQTPPLGPCSKFHSGSPGLVAFGFVGMAAFQPHHWGLVVFQDL